MSRLPAGLACRAIAGYQGAAPGRGAPTQEAAGTTHDRDRPPRHRPGARRPHQAGRRHARLDRAADPAAPARTGPARSEEHTSELQSLMRISYAVFCLKKKTQQPNKHIETHDITK